LSSFIATPQALQPRATSLFVNGYFPRRRLLVLLLGIAGGVLAAYAWNAKLVDDQIGFNTANAMLGRDANATAIGSIGSGVLFAFVSGLAGSFTACNIAVFGAVGPLVGQGSQSRGSRLLTTAKPLGWMAAGMIPVSAVYGALVGIIGTRMPQYSTVRHATGFSPRTIQTMIAFGVVAMVMVVCGLAALGLIPDPLARIARRFPNFPLVLMGALIGGFLIGRPYPLFRDLFRHAAETHNAAYGAGAFVLQSVGNMLVMSVLFVLLSYVLGARVQRWVEVKPSRATVLTASAFLVAGMFTAVYWELRVLGRLGYIWFPTAPWN
jgi:hypothetical protein